MPAASVSTPARMAAAAARGAWRRSQASCSSTDTEGDPRMRRLMPGHCPACGGTLQAWRRVPDHEPASGGSHLLLRCPLCGTAVTAGPPPGFSAAHEAGAYGAGAPRGAALAAPVLRAFDRRRLHLLGDAGA